MTVGLQPRPAPFRDARLFVIATEDARRTPWYFEGLQQHGIVGGRRLKVRLLPTEEGTSSPNQVLGRLAEFCAEHDLKPFDQLWLVLDVDRWPAFDGLLAETHRCGYRAAVSDPCIEVWFQLHFVEAPQAAPGAGESAARAAKRAWGAILQDHAGNARWPFTRSNVALAVERGQAADAGGWRPTCPGTHVHRLVGELLAFSSL